MKHLRRWKRHRTAKLGEGTDYLGLIDLDIESRSLTQQPTRRPSSCDTPSIDPLLDPCLLKLEVLGSGSSATVTPAVHRVYWRRQDDRIEIDSHHCPGGSMKSALNLGLSINFSTVFCRWLRCFIASTRVSLGYQAGKHLNRSN